MSHFAIGGISFQTWVLVVHFFHNCFFYPLHQSIHYIKKSNIKEENVILVKEWFIGSGHLVRVFTFAQFCHFSIALAAFIYQTEREFSHSATNAKQGVPDCFRIECCDSANVPIFLTKRPFWILPTPDAVGSAPRARAVVLYLPYCHQC